MIRSLALTLVATVAALALETNEPEVSYDAILLKFDPECLQGGSDTLTGFMEKSLVQKKTARSVVTGGSLSIDPKKYLDLLEKEHDAETRLIRRKTDLQARAKARRNIIAPTTSRITALKDVPAAQREDEILGALRLLAVHTIAGDDDVEEVLRAERAGDIDTILSKQKMMRSGNVRAKLMEAKEQSSDQFLALPKSMEMLDGIKIIENPVLGARLLELAEMLPCLEFPPEADEIMRGPDPRFDDDPEPAEEEYARSTFSSSSKKEVDVIDYETLKARMAEEEANGLKKPSLKAGPQRVYMKLPNDADLSEAWQLQTHWNGQKAGVGADSGWAYLIREAMIRKDPSLAYQPELTVDFADLPKLGLNFTIAIVDSGCAKHPELVNQFWRNPYMPGCNANTYEGTQGKTGDDWYNDCVGFDFGEFKPNPTINSAVYKHGTCCSTLMAAEANNGKGFAGVCPFCKIMCLKHKSASDSIPNSAVVAGWNYAIAKGAKITTNSFGSYKSTSSMNKHVYKAAITAMDKKGILVFTSAGNDRCNVDPFTSDNCKGYNADYHHNPSGHSHDNVISVGSNDKKAELSIYSSIGGTNYGKEEVDFFAPGSSVWCARSSSTEGSGSGTSYSTPIAAAVAAVVWARHPHLTHMQVKEIIMKSGAPYAEFKKKAQEPRIISMNRALAYAEQYASDAPVTTTTTTKKTTTTTPKKTTTTTPSKNTTTTTTKKTTTTTKKGGSQLDECVSYPFSGTWSSYCSEQCSFYYNQPRYCPGLTTLECVLTQMPYCVA